MPRGRSHGPGQGPAKGPGNGSPRKPLNLTAEQEAARREAVAQANRDRAVARRSLTPEVRAELEEKALQIAEAENISFVSAWIRVKRQHRGIAPTAPSPNRKEIETLAADMSVDALERLHSLVLSDKVSAHAAQNSSVSIVEIAYGRPKTAMELSGPNGGPIETSDVPARERIASRIAELASRAGAAGNTGGTD